MWALMPDEYGSYVNGNWKQLASLPTGYVPLYSAGAILPDGQYIIEGGEYNEPNADSFFTDKGAIYDPVKNTWTPVSPPPFFKSLYPWVNGIGDASSIILEDGTLMLADPASKQAALLDAKTLTWKETGTATKNDVNDEEGWTL